MIERKFRAIDSFAAFARGEGMPQWPLEVFLELSNVCDLKCAMCPTFSALSPYRLINLKETERGFLDPEQAVQPLETVLQHALNVHCFGYGEATIHPQFRETIQYLSRFEVMVDFFTNGMHLDEDLVKFLVENKVFKVTVSFSGATKEDYENVYIGGVFEQVLAGIRRLADAKLQMGSRYPIIEVNSLAFQHHIEQLEQFVELMANAGVNHVHVKPLQEHGAAINALAGHAVIVRPDIEGKVIERAVERARELQLGLAIYDFDIGRTEQEYEAIVARRREQVEQAGKPYVFVPVRQFKEAARTVTAIRPHGERDSQPRLELERNDPDYARLALDMEPSAYDGRTDGFYCMEPFKTMYVRRTGDVKPCCFADNAGPSLGVLGKHTGEQIWHGNGFASVRDGVLSGLYPMALCHFCMQHKTGPGYHFVDGLVNGYSEWHAAVNGSTQLASLVLPDNAGIVAAIIDANPAMILGNQFGGGLMALHNQADETLAEFRSQNRWAKLEKLRDTLAQTGVASGVRIEGNLDLVSREHVEGWVWTPLLPEHRFEVSVWLFGTLLASGVADRYRDDLERAGKGDGRYHYKLHFAHPLASSADLEGVEVRVDGADLVLRRSASCA